MLLKRADTTNTDTSVHLMCPPMFNIPASVEGFVFRPWRLHYTGDLVRHLVRRYVRPAEMRSDFRLGLWLLYSALSSDSPAFVGPS